MNTNKTIRFALYDNCGNLVCDFGSLEDLLEDHVEFLKDFDDYEYDINNTKITGPMASYQYADKVLKGWEIRKIEDGEEVGSMFGMMTATTQLSLNWRRLQLTTH